MKKYIKLLFSLVAVLALLTTVSCSEEDVISGEGTGNVFISVINPTAEYPNEAVTIQGAGFNEVQFLFVGNKQATFQLDGDVITFVIPESTPDGLTAVTLAMANNYRVAAEFEVLLRPTPVFSTISPSAANPGENVIITGNSLNNLLKVTVGDIEATVVSSSATELVFTVPDGPQNNARAVIEVTTSGGKTSSKSTFYVGKNLLLNGTLDEGDGDEFTNWGKWNGADGMTASAQPYTGRALKAVAAGGDAWRSQFGSDAVETIVGVEYTAYMWVKAEENGGNIRFSTNAAAGALYSGNYDITTEWQQIEWVFTANDPLTKLVLDLGVSSGMVYHVDNITLISGLTGPPPLPNLLLNGGLEDGDGDEFTNWSKMNGAEGMTASDQSYKGSRALRAESIGDAQWKSQFAADKVVTEIGKDYVVSVWIKTEANTGQVQFDVRGGDPQYLDMHDVTTEWQQIESTFTAVAAETEVVLALGNQAGMVFLLDNFSLKEVQ